MRFSVKFFLKLLIIQCEISSTDLKMTDYFIVKIVTILYYCPQRRLPSLFCNVFYCAVFHISVVTMIFMRLLGENRAVWDNGRLLAYLSQPSIFEFTNSKCFNTLHKFIVLSLQCSLFQSWHVWWLSAIFQPLMRAHYGLSTENPSRE